MFNQIVMNITFLVKLIIAKYESDFKSKNLKNPQENNSRFVLSNFEVIRKSSKFDETFWEFYGTNLLKFCKKTLQHRCLIRS